MCTLAINAQYNGIELTFEERPSEAIRNSMKAAGFRWHGVKKLWYAKNTAERMQLAEKLSGTTRTVANVDTPKTGAQKNVISKYGIKVGDILADSWGYSMTIVEFYKVTKIISSTKVEIVELGHIVTDTDRGGGSYRMPDTENYIGEPVEKIVAQNSYEKPNNLWHIKINDSISLRPWSGRPLYENTWD